MRLPKAFASGKLAGVRFNDWVEQCPADGSL
jgi:hypothetical protein